MKPIQTENPLPAGSERGPAKKGTKKLEVQDAETRLKLLKKKMFDQMNGLMTAEEKKSYLQAKKEQISSGVISAAPQRQNIDKDAEEKQLQLKCSLCKRNRPVFAGDDDIKRLPEAALSKFLKVLKADTIKK